MNFQYNVMQYSNQILIIRRFFNILLSFPGSRYILFGVFRYSNMLLSSIKNFHSRSIKFSGFFFTPQLTLLNNWIFELAFSQCYFEIWATWIVYNWIVNFGTLSPKNQMFSCMWHTWFECEPMDVKLFKVTFQSVCVTNIVFRMYWFFGFGLRFFLGEVRVRFCSQIHIKKNTRTQT